MCIRDRRFPVTQHLNSCGSLCTCGQVSSHKKSYGRNGSAGPVMVALRGLVGAESGCAQGLISQLRRLARV
eukprot:739660-Alexandrium_andersonii.AAC.1